MSRQLTEEVLVDEGTIDLVKKYNQFNKDYFNNKLPTKVEERDGKDETLVSKSINRTDNDLARDGKMWLIRNRVGSKNAGACHFGYDYENNKYQPVLITMRKGWDYHTEQDLDRVLLHEMCHAMDAINARNTNIFLRGNSQERGHGPSWQAVMKETSQKCGFDLGTRYLDRKTVVNFSGHQNRLALIERGEITFKTEAAKAKEVTKLKLALGMKEKDSIGRSGEDTSFRKSSGAKRGGSASNVKGGTVSKKGKVTKKSIIGIDFTIRNQHGISFYTETAFAKLQENIFKRIEHGGTEFDIGNIIKFPEETFKKTGYSKTTAFPPKNMFKYDTSEPAQRAFIDQSTDIKMPKKGTPPKDYIMVEYIDDITEEVTMFAVVTRKVYRAEKAKWPKHEVGRVLVVPGDYARKMLSLSWLIGDGKEWTEMEWNRSHTLLGMFGDNSLPLTVKKRKPKVKKDDDKPWDYEISVADYEHSGDIDNVISQVKSALKGTGFLEKVKISSDVDYEQDYSYGDEDYIEDFEGYGSVTVKGVGTQLQKDVEALIEDIE